MNAMPAPIVSPEPIPEPLSQGSRILNTFVAPTKTFNDLQRSASWWAPYLLMAGMSLLFSYSMLRNIGFDQIVKNNIAMSSRAEQFDKLPADQKAQQMRIAMGFTEGIAFGFPLLMLLGYLIYTGVLLGTFNLLMGAGIKFKVALAIVIFGSLPGIVRALLGIISMFVGSMSGSLDKEAFNINNPVATNLAYFMDPANKFTYSLATAVDVIEIWSLVLIGIGFACNSKVKRGTAITVVVVWFLFFRLIGAGLAMFS